MTYCKYLVLDYSPPSPSDSYNGEYIPSLSSQYYEDSLTEVDPGKDYPLTDYPLADYPLRLLW